MVVSEYFVCLAVCQKRNTDTTEVFYFTTLVCATSQFALVCSNFWFWGFAAPPARTHKSAPGLPRVIF